jgi:hypothetical protein
MQNIDHVLDENGAVTVELDKVSSRTGTKYGKIQIHFEGGYTLDFFLNNDQQNLVRMLTANKK